MPCLELIGIIIPDVVVLDVVVKISYNPKTFQKILSTKKHEGSPNPKKNEILNRAIFGKMKKTEKAPKTL